MNERDREDTAESAADERRDAAATEAEATEEQDELTRLRDERDQLDEKLKRSMADLANFRKRQVKDLDAARHRAVEGLAAELLPVLDNFHLALAAHEQQETGAAKAETHSIIEGLKMVRSLLEGTLERHGLAENPAAGTAFDPNLHEAVSVDAARDAEPGTIVQVLQRGYRFGERVLRPSRVVVSSEPEAAGGDRGAERDPAGDGGDA